MNTKEFREKVEPLIDQIQEIIDQMPDKGDKMCDSQKLCLLQALSEFSYTVNGVEDSDFMEDKEDDDDLEYLADVLGEMPNEVPDEN